jgi:hypothetical protein
MLDEHVRSGDLLQRQALGDVKAGPLGREVIAADVAGVWGSTPEWGARRSARNHTGGTIV